MSSEKLRFAYRANEDGTVDSICPHCFVTVATAMDEAEMCLPEKLHVCDPFLLAHYEFFNKAPHSEPIPKLVSHDKKHHR